jgi:hypothetical protein
MCLGKTFWAFYALRRRIGEKQPILLYQGEKSYLFCSSGVLIVPKTHGFLFSNKMWTLIDSFQAQDGIPREMATVVAGIFPIYISSPQVVRWSKAGQAWRLRTVIMNPWTKAEIEYA